MKMLTKPICLIALVAASSGSFAQERDVPPSAAISREASRPATQGASERFTGTAKIVTDRHIGAS